MADISAVILAKNEEQNITACLKSLSFCRELIVIDDNSIDQTAQIASRFGAKVFTHSLENNFAQQRNFGLKKATSDWVLFVDSDEVVSRLLQTEIKKAIKNPQFDGYFIKRIDTWLGKKLTSGEFGQICLLRLGKRKKGQWVRAVHEHWQIDGEVDVLKNILDHYPHPRVQNFISHINFHSNLHANEKQKEIKNVQFWRILVYPMGKFVYNFFVKKGYKDGTHGFVAAIIMSFHSFLAWSILWTKNKKYS